MEHSIDGANTSGTCVKCGNVICVCLDKKEAAEHLKPSATYLEMEAAIPEVGRMRGFDQMSKYHGLDLGAHSAEFVRLLEQDQNLATHPKRDLIRLAAALHDTGKAVKYQDKPDGGRSFIGHEEESGKIIDTVLERCFTLSPEDRDFVRYLSVASTTNLLTSFDQNREPKGKQLGSYDRFFAEVDKISGEDLLTKFRLVIAINRGDKGAHFNEDSDHQSEKIIALKEKAKKDSATFDELERASQALVAAVQGRRAGDQQAGIVHENGEYKYIPTPEKPKRALREDL